MTIAVFLGSLLGAMALGIPIAFSLLLCGAALMWHLNMFDAQILAQNVIEGANSFPLLAVPFFMLAGEIMNAGGISRRIVAFALSLVGHVKGGLGYVAIVSACLMAALSGSAVADAAALAALLLPMMTAAGHDKARSAGLLASASIIAPVIPPSIAFVIFGVAANVSISKLFMAGIVPGLMLGASLWITWWWLARRENVPVPPRKTRTEVAAAFKDATLALVLPVIVVVGLKFGVFTPTEAAVVAAVYALLISTLVYGELKVSHLYGLFLSAAQTTAVVMFLVAAAMVSSWLITVAQLPAMVVGLLEPLLDSPKLLMAAMMVLVMVVGTAMDPYVARDKIVIDPGVGFARSHAQSFELIRRIGELRALFGLPVLLGVSRKRCIGAATGQTVAAERVAGSFAAHLYGALQGADVVRAHDVAAHAQGLAVLSAIEGRVA